MPDSEVLIDRANRAAEAAHALLRATRLRERWEACGAEVCLVGSLATGLMRKYSRDVLLTIALLFATVLSAAFPERWFTDKAALPPGISKAEIYRRLPTQHRPIAELPVTLASAFKTLPADLTIFIGEAYFVDHCLNHHPDVADSVYRRFEEFLADPEEIVLDRRDGKDAVIFLKRLEGRLYAVVIRHYGDAQLVYKTLFPCDVAKPYPTLPRWFPPEDSTKKALDLKPTPCRIVCPFPQ